MLPNTLTILRLICVPFILILAASSDKDRLALGLALFLFAALTDWLDGFIARARKSITLFGTIMDPVTDKILILGLLLVFYHKDLLPLWLVLVNLFRELFVSGIKQAKSADGRIIGANWTGKVKFCVQAVGLSWIFLYLIIAQGDADIATRRLVVYYSVLFMTIVSIALAFIFFRWHSKGMLQQQAQGEVKHRTVEH